MKKTLARNKAAINDFLIMRERVRARLRGATPVQVQCSIQCYDHDLFPVPEYRGAWNNYAEGADMKRVQP